MTDIAAVVAEREGHEWVLFVDRDGVMNRRIPGDYVRSWEQFELLPGAVEALVVLTRWAPHVVVVTNQQGIAKGLMTQQAVDDIHCRLTQALADQGAAIDSVLVCPHLDGSGCDCRKPSPALAMEWIARHPDCVADLSIMVGDAETDMEMATRLASATGGCTAVKIGRPSARGDLCHPDLIDFARAVSSARAEAGPCR